MKLPETTGQYAAAAEHTKSPHFYGPLPRYASGTQAHCMDIDVLHAILGVCSEAGELADVPKKSMFYGRAVDYVNLDEEFGDLLWYVAIYCNARGIDIMKLMRQNIDKLAKRFPDRFTQQAALVRDLPAERAVLEAHTHGSAALDADASKLEAMGQDAGPTLQEIETIADVARPTPAQLDAMEDRMAGLTPGAPEHPADAVWLMPGHHAVIVATGVVCRVMPGSTKEDVLFVRVVPHGKTERYKRKYLRFAMRDELAQSDWAAEP